MSGRATAQSRKTLVTLLVIALIVILLILLLAIIIGQPEKQNVRAAAKTGDGSIVFFDVGQGDGALIKSGGAFAVIDTGTPEGSAGFCEKLKNMGLKAIDTLLLTHNHDDHIGGAGAVAGMFSIKNAVLPDITNTKSPTRILGTVTDEVTASGGTCTVGRSGAVYDIGSIKITVLCCYYDQSNENDRSIISIVQMDGKRFLFTGDAGSPAEKRMLQDGIDVDCDVLKAGHHGSKGASTAKFLAAATPDYAVISCGAGNKYGHPHEEAIARLQTAGAQILRTDESGDITFFVDKNALTYRTEK